MILVSNKRAFHSRISLSGTERKEGKIKVEPDNWIHERSCNFHNTRYPLSESGMDPEKKRSVRGGLIHPFLTRDDIADDENNVYFRVIRRIVSRIRYLSFLGTEMIRREWKFNALLRTKGKVPGCI